jgi:hypothetical protein
MRKLETLILASRRATENQEYTDTAGIQDEEFIQYFNDGQEEIHTLINAAFPHVLMKIKEMNVTGGVEAYSIPSDVFMGTRIDTIEFTQSGAPDNYYPLKKGSVKERLSGIQTDPSFYIRNGSQIFLQPKPQSSGSKIRITYQRTIPRLDIQRATVESVTLNTGSKTITSLVLDDSVLMDTTALLEENFITVLDKNGVVKMRSIPISAISSTGVVTVDASFVYEDGESISVGDSVCRGKYASNFSELPELCEKYLLEYCNTRILIRDSSSDSDALGQLLLKVQGTIQAAFAEPDNDPDYVPVLDGQYLGWDSF